MTKTTLTALKESIEHWRRLTSGKRRNGERLGSKDCALCQSFFSKHCQGCPVMKATGFRTCWGSPYITAHVAVDEYGLDSPEFKSAAKLELEFLESLLPKGETK